VPNIGAGTLARVVATRRLTLVYTARWHMDCRGGVTITVKTVGGNTMRVPQCQRTAAGGNVALTLAFATLQTPCLSG